jgi:hypothetical protein
MPRLPARGFLLERELRVLLESFQLGAMYIRAADATKSFMIGVRRENAVCGLTICWLASRKRGAATNWTKLRREPTSLHLALRE